MKYLAFDAETGGIKTDTSLLTLYLAVLDETFQIVDELSLAVKPNNGAPYAVTAEALRINGINLVEHDKTAISLSEAGQKLRTFLWQHSENGKSKLVPVGHNVVFDEDFIHVHLLGRGEWNKYVSYRRLDTASIFQFLRVRGSIPESVTGSLTSLVEHYGLAFDGQAHDARSDTLATVGVLRHMLAT